MALTLSLLLPMVGIHIEPDQTASAAGATLRSGDRGSTVEQIQQRLRDWGLLFRPGGWYIRRSDGTGRQEISKKTWPCGGRYRRARHR